jgi:hypothetical protein
MKIDKSFIERANRNLNLSDYKRVSSPIEIAHRRYAIPHERQYVLRMMVRSPESNGFQIPPELEWIKGTILELDAIQRDNGLQNQFVYVTIRHGEVTTKTDDIWHVDGFSMRVPHFPEQNYLWTDHTPTEYAEQEFDLPESFDPIKHHLHWYFDERVRPENIRQCKEEMIYLFDPYFVHRRPNSASGTTRTFWRISFIPIEIEDGRCQQNPLMLSKLYSGDDIRTRLSRWTNQTPA